MRSRRESGALVIVQDRSRLFRESVGVLLAGSMGVRAVPVTTGPECVDACRSQPGADLAGAVVEVTGTPWDVGVVVEGLRAAAPRLAVVGTVSGPVRNGGWPDDVVAVPRTAPVARMARALHGGRPGDGGGVPAGIEAEGGADAASRSFPRPEGARGPGDAALSPREAQVLSLLCGGLTTAEIAARLGIGAKTVEGRRETLFAKLGVQSQLEAVTVAMRSGLFGSPSGPGVVR